MLAKNSVIVLSKIKFNDYDLIVKCYSKEQGVVSYILKGVLKSKKAVAKAAYFQPLSQLQVEAQYYPNRSLHYIKDVKFNFIFNSLQSNVYKSAIVVFLAEILNMVLQEESPNESLFNFIETALQYLDTEANFSNFHLLFILKLSKFLGIYPQINNENYNFFNIESGNFEPSQSITSISDQNLTVLKMLLGTNFDTMDRIKINGEQRHAFLIMLLQYFEIHLPGFKKPKSLQIFNEVFH